VSKSKAYLAGPMRGIPDFNFPAFITATDYLRVVGWEVFNPAERDIQHGFRWAGLTGHEDLSKLGFSLRDALGDDLAFITKEADAIVLLPGWESSKGAAAELATARALGLAAYTYDPAGSKGNRLTPLAWGAPAPALPAGEEVRTVSSTGGEKGVKPERFELIPAGPLRLLARLYGRGAAKYAARNWENGYEWSKSFGAMQRHLWLFWDGEDLDEETGVPHVICAVFHAFALAHFMANPKYREHDDRPTSAVLKVVS
jgi:hypothetical protein